jgi:hypothetical protein
MNLQDWAKQELGEVDLGDERRNRRAVKLVEALAQDSGKSLAQTFSDWGELKAAYRLLSSEGVTFEAMISGHVEKTRRQCRQPGRYLLVEDNTEVDLSAHPATEGLGRIGDDRGRGFYVHSTMALKLEGGSDGKKLTVTVVGLFGVQTWVRDDTPKKGREKKRDRLLRDRESKWWGRSVEEAGSPPAGVQWTLVADREGDVYEVWGERLPPGADFIIRASAPRALENQAGQSVFDRVRHSRVRGCRKVKLRARPGVKARTAHLQVRAVRVRLRAPWRPDKEMTPTDVWVVEAFEPHPPKGVTPLHWVLLTSWPCESLEQAEEVLAAYGCRWWIEEYHKALKTGTGIEKSQLSTVDRLLALLGVCAIVALWLLGARLRADAKPDEPLGEPWSAPEILAVLERGKGPPPGGWTQRTFFRAVAGLGGFLGRKGDGEPGWMSIWRGWVKLRERVVGYEIARESP